MRKRLEEAGRAKKAKKGFLTPERKKKLRKLLMLKAAEDLKQQQMVKEQERQRILAERIIPLPDLDAMGESEMQSLFLFLNIFVAEWQRVGKEFIERIRQLESDKYDLRLVSEYPCQGVIYSI